MDLAPMPTGEVTQKAQSRRAPPEALEGEEAEAEEAMRQAEDLLRSPARPVIATEAKGRKLRAIGLLHTAARLGGSSTLEAAVDALLGMLKNTDPALLAPAVAGLNACKAFPRPLAAEAARLIVQKRAWPDRGEALRQLCGTVACADPAGVLGACLETVPRARAPQMLGFGWLLEPITAVLNEQRGDDILRAVVLICDDLKGPMSRAASAKELLEQLVEAAGEA